MESLYHVNSINAKYLGSVPKRATHEHLVYPIAEHSVMMELLLNLARMVVAHKYVLKNHIYTFFLLLLIFFKV